MSPDREDPSHTEDGALAALRKRIGPAPAGELWLGDDAAVLDVGAASKLLFCADALVEGVHFDREISSLEDIGWKSLSVNVSDLAAMGGTPVAAVVTISGADTGELEALYDGLLEAGAHYGIAIVGGDLSAAPLLHLAVAVLGRCELPAIRRDGAHPGDLVFVTGPLGSSAAGLRALRADRGASGGHVDAHRRPKARLREGQAAAAAGATSMIDVSDGFGLDLSRLLDASGVGALLSGLPAALGASAAEALGGGEDYELIFTAPDLDAVLMAFDEKALAEPIWVGQVTADVTERMLDGEPLAPSGYQHRLSHFEPPSPGEER